MKYSHVLATTAGAFGLALIPLLALADGPEAPDTRSAPLLVADAAPAAAADSGTDAAPALEAVVVTAQRRSQDVKDVPISVSVLSGDDFKAQRIANFDDISRAIPGVAFNSWGGTKG